MTSTRHPAYADVPVAHWEDWRWQLRNRVRTLAALADKLELTRDERDGIAARADERGEFEFAITPYYLSLIDRQDPTCPVRRQAVPDVAETRGDPADWVDPLAEEEHSPVPILSHRYPDRALLYVTHTCPVYCRHCTRQRKVSDVASAPSRDDLAQAIAYLADTPRVRDVLISGGDPFSLSDAKLVEVVAAVRAVKSVEIIRLCTRNPVTLPQRVTPALVEALRPHHPLWISTHFNHPRECTPEAATALTRLADAGFPISNQMVLLRGINDDVATVARLNRWLVRHRCRPYYMFQADPVRGTAHLRTPISTGLEIIDALRGELSGLAIPQFVVDLPGGGGKVALSPDRLVRRQGRTWTFRGPGGRHFDYVDPHPDPPEESPHAPPRRLRVLRP